VATDGATEISQLLGLKVPGKEHGMTKQPEHISSTLEMSADMAAPPTLDPEYDDQPQNTERRRITEE